MSITLKNVNAVKALEVLTKTYFKGFEPTLSCRWNTLTIKSAHTAHRWNLTGNLEEQIWVYSGEVPIEQTAMTINEYKAQQQQE